MSFNFLPFGLGLGGLSTGLLDGIQPALLGLPDSLVVIALHLRSAFFLSLQRQPLFFGLLGLPLQILGAQADSPSRAPAPDRAAERPGRPQEQGMREPSRVPVRPRGEPSLKWDAAAHRKATLNAFKGKLSD